MIKKFVFISLLYMQSVVGISAILKYVNFDSQTKVVEVKSLFQKSFGIEVDVTKQFTNFVHKINENKVGGDLLNRLDCLIKTIKDFCIGNYDGIIHITFNDGTGTSFIGKGYKGARTGRFPASEQPMWVYLNIDFNNKNIIFNSEYGLGSLIPAIKLSPCYPEFCEIGHCFDPFWITIAHELIHIEHFLTEELNKFVINIFIFQKTTYRRTNYRIL